MLPQLLALVRRSIPFILMVLCLGLAGCASLDSHPEAGDVPDTEPEPGTGASFRKPGPPGQLLGIDDRAREIERNLGVR